MQGASVRLVREVLNAAEFKELEDARETFRCGTSYSKKQWPIVTAAAAQKIRQLLKP